ncbi:MAG TPA: hypothetical protein PKM18_06415, partial [bacterium]|nr:hypothetical protein [bacterium]
VAGNTYPCGDFFCSDSLKSCCEGGFAGDDCSQCVRFVKESGVKTPDGLTWHTAYSTIQEAVDSANDAVLIESNGIDECEIWVAQGTYVIPATIKIYSNISILGGFAGEGDKRDNDPLLTVLDGSVNKMDNIIDATGASNVVIRSLKFFGNVNNGTGDNYAGALYVSQASNFVINSVIFDSNGAVGASADNGYEGRGGAVAVIESDVTFSDCEFKGNNAQNGERPGGLSTNASAYGGAVFVYLGNVTFSNSTFFSNTVTKRENGTASGGAIFAYAPASLTISGCTFEGNTTQNWGGAVRIEGGNAVFSNNSFNSNTATANGGAVEFNNVESASFTKNTFSKNSAATGGGNTFVQ